jgi:polysaccharide export outer membrane protein
MGRNLIFLTAFILIFIASSCNRNIRYIYKKDQGLDTIIEYPVNSEPYRIKPNDILHIKIITTDQKINELFSIDNQSNNINRTGSGNNFYLTGFTVSDSGYVEVPVLGTLKAGGKTVREFRSEVNEKTFEYLKEAIIDVKLVSFKISFLGEVSQKGTVNIYQDNIDILEAMARAGGVSDYGNMRKVTVVRQDEEKRMVYKLDLTERDLLTSNKFYLYPDDIVIVEPNKTKIVQMNIRDYLFFVSAITSAVTTTVLVINLFGN